MFTPRPYQQRAVDLARESWRAGKRAILLVAPTGAGKTALATMIGDPVLKRGKRVGFFVHREELQEQAARAFASLGVRAGIIRADAPKTDRQFQIVSIQTAARRDLDLDFDFAFLDEARHFVAPDWIGTIRKLQARGCGIVGLDATPDRQDGRGVGGPDGIFDDLIVVAQPRELIKLGYLVPCRVVGPTRARKSLADHPVAAYQQWLRGRQTIVFCSEVSYAQRLAGQFNAVGIRAACIDGTMDALERARLIALYRSGEIMVLTSIQVLTEGFDAPSTSGIITTTGASSPGPMIQKVGRGMRPAPGKIDCIHLDLRGAWHDLGMLPDEDRIFSLDGRAITGAKRELGDAVVQCRGCGCWFRANEFKNSTCPLCGAVRKGREDPRIRKARMSVVADAEIMQDRVLFLAREYFSVAGKKKKSGQPYKAFGYALRKFMVKYRRRANEQEVENLRAYIDAAKKRAASKRKQGELFA